MESHSVSLPQLPMLSWEFIPRCLGMLPWFAPKGRAITWGIEWRHYCEAVGRLRRAGPERKSGTDCKELLPGLGIPWRALYMGRGQAETHRQFMPCPAPPGR